MNAVVVQMQDQGATTPPKAGEAAQALELNRLLQAATQRCTVSFKRLYGLTRPRLFAIVLAINRDRVDSEDVLQEVYLKVWDNCGQFDAQKGHVVSWLSGIAHHSALDSLRRRRRPVRQPPDRRARGSGPLRWPDVDCGDAAGKRHPQRVGCGVRY